jgi:hypothetical protein
LACSTSRTPLGFSDLQSVSPASRNSAVAEVDAAEPIVGRLKVERRMARDHLKGRDGDHTDASSPLPTAQRFITGDTAGSLELSPSG